MTDSGTEDTLTRFKPVEPFVRIRHFFVDEAGDGTLFGKRGRVLIGTEGCSRYFLLGVLDAAEPERLAREMEELRARLLDDPYFKGVPSMQPSGRKTALAFHAKDDVSEVRREVLHLLGQHELRFYAVVRDKNFVLGEVTKHEKRYAKKGLSFRYHPNWLYDVMVSKLFTGLLHKYDEYDVHFARRGNSTRTAALSAALLKAQERVNSGRRASHAAPLAVTVSSITMRPELQAVDYFLWALQRFFERGEDRYIELLWPAFRSVCFMGDPRQTKSGEYYTQRRPLTLAAFESLPGI